MNSLSNYAHLFLCSHELGFVTLFFGQSFEHVQQELHFPHIFLGVFQLFSEIFHNLEFDGKKGFWKFKIINSAVLYIGKKEKVF